MRRLMLILLASSSITPALAADPPQAIGAWRQHVHSYIPFSGHQSAELADLIRTIPTPISLGQFPPELPALGAKTKGHGIDGEQATLFSTFTAGQPGTYRFRLEFSDAHGTCHAAAGAGQATLIARTKLANGGLSSMAPVKSEEKPADIMITLTGAVEVPAADTKIPLSISTWCWPKLAGIKLAVSVSPPGSTTFRPVTAAELTSAGAP